MSGKNNNLKTNDSMEVLGFTIWSNEVSNKLGFLNISFLIVYLVVFSLFTHARCLLIVVCGLQKFLFLSESSQ